MKITVASGKGGTGKTTVTASLASIWDKPVVAVDLDVEEPNLHLFLHPEISPDVSSAWMEIPVLDPGKCTKCGDCVEICQFKAISMMLSTLTVYPDMCHGCGGCMAICKPGALEKGKRELGKLYRGQAGDIAFLSGTLRIGEAMSPPLMDEVKKEMEELISEKAMDAIIDAPPGVSCPALCSVIDSDVIVLVTDATPFGLHDFQLAWQSFAPLQKPMGVVINRAGLGTDAIYDFCKKNFIPILAEIPFDRKIAETYSQGKVICEASSEIKNIFIALQDTIRQLAEQSGKEVDHA